MLSTFQHKYFRFYIVFLGLTWSVSSLRAAWSRNAHTAIGTIAKGRLHRRVGILPHRQLRTEPTGRCFQAKSSDTLVVETNAHEEISILYQDDVCLVVNKPPSVVVHHSGWTGSRARQEIPMIQRVRDQVGRKVNLVHRLDRGCSGCLLMTYADGPVAATAALCDAMAQPTSNKTYIALVRGEGILKGRDFRQEQWFFVDRAIADERGVINDAKTWFRFVAGQDNQNGLLPDRPRASIVLAKPETGRWHQIRRHLNGLSHPILGDSTHGNSRVNREWKQRGMIPERTCLHLARLQLPPTEYTPKGIDVVCPLATDMMFLLEHHLPELLPEARPVLEQEGVLLS